MTEPIEPTPTDPAPEPPPDDDAGPQTLDHARKLRSEARNLRERLHATETERDELKTDREALITRLAAAERADVLRIAADYLVDPTDIWSAQSDMAAFYDENFEQITADKVVAAAKELVTAKPHLARPNDAPPPTDRPLEGLRGGAVPEAKPKAPTWSEAIRGAGG